jgi:hypothetical protein
MVLPPADFESAASTDSAISARHGAGAPCCCAAIL